MKNRAALDVGSGTTKLKVAQVNICTHKILKVLAESHRKVSYAASLESNNQNIPDHLVDKGIVAINELKKIASKYGVVKMKGVATSAFRLAKNGQAVIDRINTKVSGLSLKRITQREEAEIGYAGVEIQLEKQKKNFVLWDIGGGSMQILAKKDGQVLTYFGNIASNTFRTHFLSASEIKQGKVSPNPISKKEFKESLVWLKKELAPKIKEAKLETVLSEWPVYGIGGVHNYAVSKVINKKTWTASELRSFIQTRLGKGDKELGGSDQYKPSRVSNLILVLGFMEAFGIEKVSAKKVNLTDALLAN